MSRLDALTAGLSVLLIALNASAAQAAKSGWSAALYLLVAFLWTGVLVLKLGEK